MDLRLVGAVRGQKHHVLYLYQWSSGHELVIDSRECIDHIYCVLSTPTNFNQSLSNVTRVTYFNCSQYFLLNLSIIMMSQQDWASFFCH